MLNIGAGFYRHAGASLYKTSTGDSTYQDHLAIGADVFMELPINKAKGTMFHALATFYSLNYGINYIRNIGILNEHGSVSAVAAGRTADSWPTGGGAPPADHRHRQYFLPASRFHAA